MFFPELRIATIRLFKGTGSSAAQDIAELGMKHASSPSTDKNWAWLVSTKVDISTLADKSTRDHRNKSVRGRAATPEILLFLTFLYFRDIDPCWHMRCS